MPLASTSEEALFGFISLLLLMFRSCFNPFLSFVLAKLDYEIPILSVSNRSTFFSPSRNSEISMCVEL